MAPDTSPKFTYTQEQIFNAVAEVRNGASAVSRKYNIPWTIIIAKVMEEPYGKENGTCPSIRSGHWSDVGEMGDGFGKSRISCTKI